MKRTPIIGAVAVALLLAGCSAVGSQSTPHAEATTGAPARVTTLPTASATPVAVDPSAYDLPWLGADDGVAFNSPDNNIACGIDKNSETGDMYGCAIAHYTYKDPPAPADAVDPCGGGFWRFKDAAPGILCSGEPQSFAGQPGGASSVKPLPLGSSITYNNVTCTSAANGITCLSADGHGFRIAPDSYQLY